MSSKIDFYAPSNQYVVLTRLIRYGQSLTCSEFKVLMFIYDRTLGYRKQWESIPYRHFLDGVVGRDGRRHCFGCGLGETALKRAIRGLVEKRVVVRQREENSYMGTFYAIVITWEQAGIETLWTPDAVRPIS